jgi:hypothetical protein
MSICQYVNMSISESYDTQHEDISDKNFRYMKIYNTGK